MEGFVLGIDLCDDYCRVSGSRSVDIEPRDIGFAQADGRTVIQTALGKKRDVNEWLMGKEAYEAALTGAGFVVDKLLSRLMAGESLSVGAQVYTAVELMSSFFKNLIDYARQEFTGRELQKLVISVQKVNVELIDALIACTDRLEIARDKVHIVSHTESFLYYVLSQKKDYWANESVLFDWSGRELHYYSMNVTRGVRPHIVRVDHQLLEGDLSVDNIEDERRQKVVDSLLASYAEKLMQKKVISSVLLSGKGLEECQNWAKISFLQTVGHRRRVYREQNVFARGAVVIGNDDLREHSAYPYVVICEGRIQASVMMEVMQRGTKRQLVLAQQGSCWYEIRTNIDLILDNMDSIHIKVVASEGKLIRTFSIPLDNFPHRPPKTTRVQVILNFNSENEAVVRVVDMGFGEMFPASGAVKKSKIMLQ